MTVGELGRRMDSAELSEWLAFEQAYGIPDAYFITAQVCTTVARIMGAKVDGGDFVPYFRKDARRRMSGDEMFSLFKAFAARQNAKQP